MRLKATLNSPPHIFFLQLKEQNRTSLKTISTHDVHSWLIPYPFLPENAQQSFMKNVFELMRYICIPFRMDLEFFIYAVP